MKEPAPQVATVDVAHEVTVRRWALGVRIGGCELLGSVRGQPAALPDARDRLLVGPGDTLRIAALCAGGAQSVRAIRRAVLAGGGDLVLVLRADEPLTFGERAGALRTARPDVIVVDAAERDAGPVLALLEALRAGCADQAPRPRLVASGDARSLLRLRTSFAPFAVEVMPDPRRDDGIAALAGRIREFRRGTAGDIVLRDEALDELARALALAGRVPTIVVDVTGASTSIVRAMPEGSLTAVHLVGLGAGTGADRVVARGGLDRVRRWIPWPVDAPSLLERVFNRARWPDAVPVDTLALTLEMALAREAISHAVSDALAALPPGTAVRDAPQVVITGRVAEFPRAAQALLVAVDALEPSRVATYARDRADALVAVGALAARVRARGADPMGIVAGVLSRAREDVALVAPLVLRRAATLRIVQGASRSDQHVAPGALTLLPAAGDVELVASGAHLRGNGRAGTLGVLVDARGRPLVLPQRDAERVPTVARWHAAVSALASFERAA